MDWLTQIFRAYPVIPIFLTLGLGFWIGQMRYRAFSLGPVAATLLIGVLIGQMDIRISDTVKSIFFMLFLFSIAYSVGPQFFRSFRGPGLKQVAFAILEALICAGTVIAAARIMGYDSAVATGLFAGSQTSSASLGVASETVRGMALAASDQNYLLAMIPASYAVTYVFGTAGSAWFLSSIGPMMLGGLKKVKEETAAIEAEMDSGEYHAEPGYMVADRPVSFRAYRADSDFFAKPRRIEEIESIFAARNQRVFVERCRIRGEIAEPSPALLLSRGDALVLSGRRENMVGPEPEIGPEIADHELLSFGAERLPVTIGGTEAAKMAIGELRSQSYMKGVIIASLSRNGMALPVRNRTALQRGDILTLVGLPRDVGIAAAEIGYSDRETDQTDMVFLGLGLAAGCFIGALSFRVNGVPLSLSITGGALLSGLVLGWLRSRRPSFGRIPGPVIWIFDNLGLNMFIAVVGISSGPTFIAGLREAGIGLFLVGIACTLFALTVNIFIGRKLFGFSSPETLGCVAGARCGVASIGAIQDTLESSVPAIGYTVTYAVANLILPFSSLIVLALA